MEYKKRRIESGLSIYTMAKELGISEEKYKLIEKGSLNLEGDLLNKFLDILKRKNEIIFNRKAKMVKIDEWLKSGQAVIDIEKLGYTKWTISTFLGYDSSYVNNMIRSDFENYWDAKEKLYDFVKNPLNKNIEEKEPVLFTKNEKKDKIEEWVDSGQAKSDIEKLGYKQAELSRIVFNKRDGFVNDILKTKKKKRKTIDSLKKLYDFIHSPQNVKKLDIQEKEEKKKELENPKIEETKILPIVDNEPTLIIEENIENLTEKYNLLLEEKTALEKENEFLKESIKRLFKF